MNRQMSPRWMNIGLGVWLVISAYLWPHTMAQFNNALAIGAACTIFAAVALRIPQVRYVNVALAAWLFFSTWTLPVQNVATSWNNIIVAILMLVVALVPSRPEMAYR